LEVIVKIELGSSGLFTKVKWRAGVWRGCLLPRRSQEAGEILEQLLLGEGVLAAEFVAVDAGATVGIVHQAELAEFLAHQFAPILGQFVESSEELSGGFLLLWWQLGKHLQTAAERLAFLGGQLVIPLQPLLDLLSALRG
jgi:hypothetical protein